MKLVDHPEALAGLRRPTAADPWRVLVSACLTGAPCGVDGGEAPRGGDPGLQPA